MKKRSLWLITALMTIALLGVFVMQLYYIREAYTLKSQLFEHDINEALNDVASKVQKRYAALHIDRKDQQVKREKERDFRDRAQQIVDYKENYKIQQEKREQERERRITADLMMQDSLIRLNTYGAEIISEEIYQEIVTAAAGKSPLEVRVDMVADAFGNVRGNIKQTIHSKKQGLYSLKREKYPDTLRYLAQDLITLKPVTINLPKVTPETALKHKIEDKLAQQKYKEGLKELLDDTVALEANGLKYLEDLAKEMRQVSVPIEQRVPKDDLDTLIKKELLNRNINLNYDFWVKLANKDSLLYRQANNFKGEFLSANTYKVPLFGNDIFRDPGMLYVNFPNKNSLILGNMWATMASSAGLLMVLVFIFTYTIYAIIRQKKISEMKTDFINNMTHEFKTPVATIMIASEALKDPEIVEDKKRISRLAGIIYDENVRLGNHIERVLSIARLEKKELKLEHHEVNINDLVVAVLDSMELQLQKKNAAVDLELDAVAPVVLGDELHLSNVLYNLVDNANKYSAENPKITISTKNTNKALIIEIADEGIGMTKEQSKRIFDQFYRVPTGNLHDVKGFGLGLNYVQDIITQMGGTIKVNSEKDKGTKFIISLPLN
ncbi:MAG: HAMP domain-containing histidine kinase [Pedobacter sp.]|nr:MAG: HAMP domain-containing histidine kinase [Pedobacter sp.]